MAIIGAWVQHDGSILERRVIISREEFFGTGGYSPITGDAIMAAMERIRRRQV